MRDTMQQDRGPAPSYFFFFFCLGKRYTIEIRVIVSQNASHIARNNMLVEII